MLMGERSVWPESSREAAPGTEGAVVGLVLVGHSADVVRGLLAMIAQAAPGVPVDGAGGLSGGRLGTNALEVGEALRRVLAAAGDGVVVLLDLGSASMALDLALSQLDAASRARVRISEGPFVEGAVLAAVTASGGGSLEAVARAADTALDQSKLAGG
jgi:dihydroxyacetone kinase DhaKLM complex PTS-EIIA-like component DhaM